MYDYKNAPHHGEFNPYNKHRGVREFERARSGDLRSPSDIVKYENSHSPHRKYFQFEDRKERHEILRNSSGHLRYKHKDYEPKIKPTSKEEKKEKEIEDKKEQDEGEKENSKSD